MGKESALEDLSALEQIKDNAQAELDNDSHTASTNESVNTDSQMLITQSESKQTDTNSDDNKPAKPKRERRIVIPDNLEVRTIIHEPESITCGCGCQMKQIGEDVQDKLGFKPKQFYRERHVYPKYTCRNAACNRERLVQAKTEPQIIDKSIATPELLAHILISKYADHLPLYRQSLIYQRSGVYLSDSTLADWVGRCGVQLRFLVNRLIKLILTQPIVHADETPVNILKFNNNKGKLKQGYVWAYLTPQHCQSYGGFKAVVYDFAESRRNEHPKAFLDKWQGQLICDDYNGYKCLFNQKQAVIEVGCMAHARRKFEEALDFVFYDGDHDNTETNIRKSNDDILRILNGASTRLYICDVFFDKKSLLRFVLPMGSRTIPVKILSGKKELKKDGRREELASAIKAMNKNGIANVECRLLIGDKAELHDRFIVADENVWMLGCSLNEFGSRATTLIRVP